MSTKKRPKQRRCAVSPCSLSEDAMAELAAKVANDVAEDIDCRESRETLRAVIRWWSLRSCVAHSELSLAKTDIAVGRLALNYALPLIKRQRSGAARCARELGKIFLKANANVQGRSGEPPAGPSVQQPQSNQPSPERSL